MSPHVHPTRDDRVVASLSEVVGGPVGSRAGRPGAAGGSWWTPVRVLLAMTAVVFALGMVSKSACAADDWDAGSVQFSRLCYSDLPGAYTGTGLVELSWPWSGDEQDRARYAVTDQPALVSYWQYAAARATHLLTGSPDLDRRYARSLGDVTADPDVAHERAVFVAVNAVGLGLVALLAAAALAAAHRRRPWDASLFAAAPVLALAGLVSWDLLAAAAVAGALWAWSRERPVLTGVLVGVGAAAGVWPFLLLPALLLVALRGASPARGAATVLPTAVTALATWGLVNAPAFITGRAQWERFWEVATSRTPERGSLWTVLDGAVDADQVAPWSWGLIGLWCAAVAALALLSPVAPRVSQVAFLLVAGVLVLGVDYRPQQALWLLPLAVLARPRWRDQLVWQSGEVVYFAMVWWFIGGYLAPGGGGPSGFYWIAIVLRVLAVLYLVAVVVRDVWWPHHDPLAEQRPGGREQDQLTTTRSNAVAV